MEGNLFGWSENFNEHFNENFNERVYGGACIACAFGGTREARAFVARAKTREARALTNTLGGTTHIYSPLQGQQELLLAK